MHEDLLVRDSDLLMILNLLFFILLFGFCILEDIKSKLVCDILCTLFFCSTGFISIFWAIKHFDLKNESKKNFS